MKHKPDFILQEVADTQVVVPVGEQALAFNGILTLNGTGAFLWKLLGEDTNTDAMVKALTATYDVEEQTARADVQTFVSNLKEKSLLID